MHKQPSGKYTAFKPTRVLQEVEGKWAVRHEVEGAAVYEMLLDLSSMYVKSAQILASKGDFMPEPWVRCLAAMFDSMPPKPWIVVQWVRHLLGFKSNALWMLMHWTADDLQPEFIF